jgi:glycerol-3-phosphate dehydrogenase (NAD(P)+)
MSAIAVLGAGSFGTTLAVHAAAVTERVVLWARRPELAAELAARRENALFLPGIRIPPAVEPTADLAAAADCELALVAIPSHGFRDALRAFLAAVPGRGRVALVSLAKGIEEGSLARMSEVAAAEAAAAGRELSFAVLSGPCFAVELARGAPTAAVVAAADAAFATEVQRRLATASLRLYSSEDVVGVELAAAAKNVIAIAAGVVAGLGLGHNALAALITRGLHEIARLGLAYGGQPPTFSGLAGLGDLVLTCTGEPSRNRRAGIELAGGRTVEQLLGGTRMVAEGIRSSRAVARLADRRQVVMPITEQVVGLLYEGQDPRQAVTELMTRELKPEAKL